MSGIDWLHDFGIYRRCFCDFRPGLNLVPVKLETGTANWDRMAVGIMLEHPPGGELRFRGEEAPWRIQDALRSAWIADSDLALLRLPAEAADPEAGLEMFCVMQYRLLNRLLVHDKTPPDAVLRRLLAHAGGAEMFMPDAPAWRKPAPGADRLIAGSEHLQAYKSRWSKTVVPLYEPDLRTPPQKAVGDLVARLAKGTMIPYLLKKGAGR